MTDRRLKAGIIPEFGLLLACCAANFAGGLERRVTIPATLDWDSFLRLARFHRVQGLAWTALAASAQSLPPNVASLLAADARTIAAVNLGIVAASAELQRAFAEAGERLLFVKGLAIAAIVYRSPMVKMSWDIDLLVDPAAVTSAGEILARAGFRPVIPPMMDGLAAWHAREKESVWAREADGVHVELHTRLAENEALVPSLTVASPSQTVAIANDLTLTTLADTELFAYLAVHGASSAWFRLKWISDFAGFLHCRTGGEIRSLHESSQALGAGRAPAQALLLADRLFGSLERAPELRSELQTDHMVRLLCSASINQVTSKPVEPTEQVFGTLRIHWTQLLLMTGFKFKAAEFWRQTRKALRRVDPHRFVRLRNNRC